jgi:hypothetical protein
MPLEGRQLTYDTALARCYEVGWRGQNLLDAVALMCAESGRFTEAYHDNLDADGNVDSRDRGLFQINDKWHPELSDEDAYKVRTNIAYAHKVFVGRDRTFGAWMAYESGAYKKFLPYVTERYNLGKWREKLDA